MSGRGRSRPAHWAHGPALPLRSERARRKSLTRSGSASAGPRNVCTACAGTESCGKSSLWAAPAGPHGAVFRPGVTPGRGVIYHFGNVGLQREVRGGARTCAHCASAQICAPFGVGQVFGGRVFNCARALRAFAAQHAKTARASDFRPRARVFFLEVSWRCYYTLTNRSGRRRRAARKRVGLSGRGLFVCVRVWRTAAPIIRLRMNAFR